MSETTTVKLEPSDDLPSAPAVVWGVLTIWTNNTPDIAVFWTREEAMHCLRDKRARMESVRHELVKVPLAAE